jgi:hypothetical protein
LPAWVKSVFPRTNSFAVSRSSSVYVALSQPSSVDLASLQFVINGAAPVTNGDPRLKITQEVLKFTPAPAEYLGAYGQTATVVVSALDRSGTGLPSCQWSFELELEPKINPQAVLVPKPQDIPAGATGLASLRLVSNDGNDWTLSYAGSTNPLTPGQILVGEHAGGVFYRRVEAIKPAGGVRPLGEGDEHRVTLATLEVPLDDVIDEGSVTLSCAGSLLDPECAVDFLFGNEATDLKLYSADALPFDVILQRLMWELQGEVSAAVSFAGLQKRCELHAEVDLHAEAKLLLDFVNCNGSYAASTNVLPLLTRNKPLQKNFVLKIGFVPVLVTVSFDELLVGLATNWRIEANVTTGCTYDQHAEFTVSAQGHDWNGKGSLEPPQFSVDPVSLTAEGEGSIQLYLQPKFSLLVYRAVGLSFDAKPFIEAGAFFDATRAHSESAYVDWGLTNMLRSVVKFWPEDGGDLPEWPLYERRGHLWGRHALKAHVDPLEPERVYGQPNPDFRLGYSGFVDCYAGPPPSGDPPPAPEDVLDEKPVARCSALPDSPIGRYEVLIEGGRDDVYKIIPYPSQMTVRPAPLTITANDLSVPFTNGLQASMLNLSSNVSGLARHEQSRQLPVSLRLEPEAILAPGPYQIIPELSERLTNYDVSLVSGLLNVTKDTGQDWCLSNGRGGKNPSQAIDSLGRIHVVWDDEGNIHYSKYYSNRWDSSQVPIVTNAVQPQCVLDAEDYLHVVALSLDRRFLVYAKINGETRQVLSYHRIMADGTDLSYACTFDWGGITLDAKTGNPVLGAIRRSILTALPYYPPPPPMVFGFTMGEVIAYIAQLGIWATAALPHEQPVNHAVMVYWLDSSGIDVKRTLVRRIFEEEFRGETLDGLAIEGDSSGRIHTAWRESPRNGPSILAYCPVRVGITAEAQNIQPIAVGEAAGPPSLCADAQGISLAWAEPSQVRFRRKPTDKQGWEEVEPWSGSFFTGARVALAPIPEGWVLSWSDSLKRKLLCARVAAGTPMQRTGASAVRVRNAWIGHPDLASSADRWALVYDASDSAGRTDVYLYRGGLVGECFALKAEGNLWDRTASQVAKVDDPVEVLCLPSELLDQEKNLRPVYGVVADGITPLVFRLQGVDRAKIKFEIVDSKTNRMTRLEPKLRIAQRPAPGSTGNWQWRDPNFVDYDQVEDLGSVFLCLQPLTTGEASVLGWPAEELPQQLELSLRILDAEKAGEVLGEVPFRITKPLLVLVHGYYADAGSWDKEKFVGQLAQYGFSNRVVAVSYGTNGPGGSPASGKGEYLNTTADFLTLAPELHAELLKIEQRYGLFYAMTRYDALGHSQGGVLLRLLCTEKDAGFPGFRDVANFYRGRFRRVITANSPHNGSTLAFYLMALRQEVDHLKAQGQPGLGSQQLLGLLEMVKPNLVQRKFDPFSTVTGHIRDINTGFPTHQDARFHLIGSAIKQARAEPGWWVFAGLGLWKDERLHLVIPPAMSNCDTGQVCMERMSDGVVDYQSQIGGVAASHRTELSCDYCLPVAHVPQQLLFGTEESACNSGWVAKEVHWRLEDDLDGSDFGQFINPVPLTNSLRDAIQAEAKKAAEEAAANANLADLVLQVLPLNPVTQGVALFKLLLDQFGPLADGSGGVKPLGGPPQAQPQWVVQVYAPDERDRQTVRWRPLEGLERGLELQVPEGLVAQVVVMAQVLGEDGRPRFVRPAVAYDNLTPRITQLHIGVPGELYRGDSATIDFSARLEDGRVSDFFIDHPEQVVWSSTDTNLLQVRQSGEVVAGPGLGRGELSVNYRQWSGHRLVDVVDSLPYVRIVSPSSLFGARTGQAVPVEILATDREGALAAVELKVDGAVVQRWTSAPYRMTWLPSGPGQHVLQAVAYDRRGGQGVSAEVKVMASSTAPGCVFDGLVADQWHSGDLLLKAVVSDADGLQKVLVYFDYSLNSTDGMDGDWDACGPALGSAPYCLLWRSLPTNALNTAVWLRTYAVDAQGLASPSDVRRIRVDNTSSGVMFEPHPGQDHVALGCEISVRFLARPAALDGIGLSDDAIGRLPVLRDANGLAVACVPRLADEGRTVFLKPIRPLAPGQTYVVETTQPVMVQAGMVPKASSGFRTTYGAPSSLRVLALPASLQAGVPWEPPVEVMVSDTAGNRVENAQAEVTLSLVGPDGAIIADYFSAAENGVARFSGVRSLKAGSLRLALKCPTLSLAGVASAEVLPGPLGSLALQIPELVTAGQTISLVASAYDLYGNLKTDYVGAPALSSCDPRARISPLPAFRLADRGTRVYSEAALLGTLGDQWLALSAGRVAGSNAPVKVLNAQPLRPEAISPVGMAVCGLAPHFKASAFADLDNAAHGASQWQISGDALFQNPVWDSGVTDPATELALPQGLLQPNQAYYWRVRYRDAPSTAESPLWSDWSLPGSFHTAFAFPFADSFSQDTGWRASLDGLWQHGPANGTPPQAPADDTSAGADRFILATSLNGIPPSYFTTPYRIVSPAVDCSAQRLVELSFNRWLQIDSSDWAQAEVAVSVDGLDWVPVWRNGLEGVRDESWQEMRYDITDIAAFQPTVYVSFSLGPQYFASPSTGWHIDDVRLQTGAESPVKARLEIGSTNVLAGQIFEARIWVKEDLSEVSGVRGGAFDILYDATGLQLVSPANPAAIVVAPFNQVKTAGEFTPGRITGLGGATLTNGFGNGEYALFAKLQFRPLKPGTFDLSLEPGSAGCVLPLPIGLVNKARVLCESPGELQVNPAPIVPDLEFRLEGPTNRVKVGDSFEVRVAVRENHPLASGFLGGAVDLYFDSILAEPILPLDLASIVHTSYQSLGILSGTVAENRIDELGGVTLAKGLGDGTFITYLRVPFRAKSLGTLEFTLGFSASGLVLASPVGEIPESSVDMGPPLQVTVAGDNTAPRLMPVADQAIDELKPFTLALPAQDNDVPTNRLVFSLLNGPSGLSVDAAGTLRWTPAEAQGPSTNQVTVKVTDDGVPSLSATNSFKVSVREVNSPPTVLPPPEQVVEPLQSFLLRLTAQDSDLPTNKLVFALVQGPAGLAVDSFGNVRWTPTVVQGPSTNLVTVKVTDDGSPSLAGTNTFRLIVRGDMRLNPPKLAGGYLELSWTASRPCLLQKADSLTSPNWTDLPESAGVGTLRVVAGGKQAFYRLRQVTSQ